MTDEEFFDEIDRKLKAIENPTNLYKFVEFLSWGYENGFFEEQPVSEYLGGIEGITYSWGRKLAAEPNNPDLQLTWSLVGLLLFSAFAHS